MIINTPFVHSVGSETVAQHTEIVIQKDDRGLCFSFSCFDDPYVAYNGFRLDNDPLWQQEVLEVFISVGEDTPTTYFEFQINPNNAVFLASVTNPDGKASSNTLEMLDPKSYALENAVTVDLPGQAWKGTFRLPFTLLGAPSSVYRANIFRIIRTSSLDTSVWRCTPQNSTFACWQPTHCVDKPSFHRPEAFGSLRF